MYFFFFQAEDGIRDGHVTGVQTCALPISYYGYEAGQAQSEFTVTGIALMLTVFPGVFHALMGLVMFKYKITNDFYIDMQTQQGKTDIRSSKSGLSEEYLNEQPL